MAEALTALLPYTPLLIFVAAFLDVFCLTGLFLYGGAMLGSVAALLIAGAISPIEVTVAATLGTLFGSTTNFFIGYFGAQVPFVEKLLQKKGAKKIKDFTVRRHLFITIVVGRFITLARPLYGLVLGTLHTKPRRFFMYEIPVVFFWVVIWLGVLIQGEKLIRYLFLS